MFLDAGKLRDVTYKRGHTQKSLASASGVSLTTISGVFRGCRCSPKTGEKLAGALGVPLSEITDER